MRAKHLIRLTCRVCGKVEQHRDYLSRWPKAVRSSGATGAEYEASHVCSIACDDIARLG